MPATARRSIRVCAAIDGVRGLTSRAALQQQLPAGAARNALDCALWDYEAKRDGTTAAALAGLTRLRPLTTAYTLSLDSADAMATKAAAASSARPAAAQTQARGARR